MKYIGAYSALLDGTDAIIFTGGIGENSSILREQVLEKLSSLGVSFDKKVNDNSNGKEPGLHLTGTRFYHVDNNGKITDI